MSDLVIRRESIHTGWDEATRLMEAHWEEVETVPLAMNKDLYLQLEVMDMLHVYTIRDLSKLVGYGVWTSSATTHHASTKIAICDAIYIVPAYRGLPLFSQFLDYAEASLTGRGIEYINMNVKTKKNFGPVLKRKGYNHIESVYAKKLGA